MSNIPTSYPTQIRVVTLNCWGLKFLAAQRNERLTEIGKQLALASPAPEIVGLQECWTQEDYESIREHTKHILPYGKFYFSGMFGGGLAILSRWPIEESNMYRYPLNGRPTAFFRGDWFVGKGVACARIRIGPGAQDIAEVFCTHLHAPYEREPNDSYLCHRTAQAWDIAKLMRGAAERGHFVLGLGDFNMLPLSLAHRVIEAHAPVKDVWRVAYPDSSIGAADYPLERQRGLPVPSIDYNLTYNGATCDSGANTWRWSKQRQKQLKRGRQTEVNHSDADPAAKRLDYIFYSPSFFSASGSAVAATSSLLSSPSSPTGRRGSGKLSVGRQASISASARRKVTCIVKDVSVGMIQRHPTLKCSLSDHFSVEATFQLLCSSVLPAATAPVPAPLSSTAPSPSAITTTTTTASTQLLSPRAYQDIFDNLQSYVLREKRQRRLRLLHFVLSVIISVACLVGVWFVPAYGAFILSLASTLNFAAGVIDGLIGGLFVSSELRALREFEWEVTAALGQANDLLAIDTVKRTDNLPVSGAADAKQDEKGVNDGDADGDKEEEEEEANGGDGFDLSESVTGVFFRRSVSSVV